MHLHSAPSSMCIISRVDGMWAPGGSSRNHPPSSARDEEDGNDNDGDGDEDDHDDHDHEDDEDHDAEETTLQVSTLGQYDNGDNDH